jgi:hypothetical protein
MRKTEYLDIKNLSLAGAQLCEWMGSFWFSIFSDPDLVKQYAEALGILSAQQAESIQDARNVLSREFVPVFKRMRWYPVVIKRGDRNTGEALRLRTDMDPPPVIGKQVTSPYPIGEIFEIGGYAESTQVTGYAISGLNDVATSLSDSIDDPNHVVVRGVDYYVDKDTIVFAADKDPFETGWPISSSQYGDFIVMWAHNATFDMDYVKNYAGVIVGVEDESSEFYANYVDALWTLHNLGTRKNLFMAGLAAIFDLPCTGSEVETVEAILDDAVITSAAAYDISDTEALLSSDVQVGVELPPHTVLTNNLNVYERGQGVPDGLYEYFPVLFLSSRYLRINSANGVGFPSAMKDLIYVGNNANGSPQLEFDLTGPDEDVASFWEDFHAYCEYYEVNEEELFAKYLASAKSRAVGSRWGQLRPMEYLFDSGFGANTIFIHVDTSNLSTAGKSGIKLVSLLSKLIPAHVAIFGTVSNTASPDEYGLDQVESAVPALSNVVSDTAQGERMKKSFSFYDCSPKTTLIPKCWRRK